MLNLKRLVHFAADSKDVCHPFWLAERDHSFGWLPDGEIKRGEVLSRSLRKLEGGVVVIVASKIVGIPSRVMLFCLLARSHPRGLNPSCMALESEQLFRANSSHCTDASLPTPVVRNKSRLAKLGVGGLAGWFR